VQVTTKPDDCIVIDDLSQAVMMDRNVIPIQAELSIGRVEAGYLTEADLVRSVMRAECQVVIFSAKKRFDTLFPGFREWVETAYLRHLEYGHQEMYLIRRDVTPPVTATPPVDLGGAVQLVAAVWDGNDWYAGQTIPIVFYWRATAPSQVDYKVFVHLRDVDNQTVAQLDYQPYGGILPTTAWPLDQVLKETVWFSLSPDVDLRPGPYSLLVGLYDPVTLERLPVIGDVSGENAVILGEVAIK
jgi:hypothetical protein